MNFQSKKYIQINNNTKIIMSVDVENARFLLFDAE